MTGRERLKVAVVGTGRWAHEHARVFSRRADTRLCAIVGRDATRTAAQAAAYDTASYTDLGSMLEKETPDLVTVCLANEHHFEATRALVETGVALLVEKPLVFDLGEADELLRCAEESGSFFAIDFNHRFAEPVQRARQLIDSGRLGDPVFATWRFGGEANHGTSRHANLIETQCHGFDLLEFLVGPISSVMAQMTDKTYGDWSTVALALEFDNGAVGTMLGSYDTSYAYPDSQLIEVNGTLGRLVIHDTVRELTFSAAGDDVEQRWRAGYFDDEARSFHHTFDRHVDAIVEALVRGRQPPVHARAGRRALRLADAAIRSHDRGIRVGTTN